jgi:threonine dehydrogenase-like Zn-dependent dehydrogenase
MDRPNVWAYQATRPAANILTPSKITKWQNWVDPEVRKAKAPGAGADRVFDPRASDVTAEGLELTGGRGADVSFECAGIDAVLKSAIQSTRAGGTVVNVAIWGHEASVAMNDLVFRPDLLRW